MPGPAITLSGSPWPGVARYLSVAATRVRWALASLACSLAGAALFVLLVPLFTQDRPGALFWVVPPAALEVVAVVLANRSLQSDPKGGPWHWLAVTAFVLPLILMLLPLIGLALLIVNLSQTN